MNRLSLAAVVSAWRLPTLVVLAVGLLVVNAVVSGPVKVPGREVSEVLWPLSVALVTVGLGNCLPVFASAFERRSRALRRRILFVVSYLVVGSLACIGSALAMGEVGDRAVVLTRNLALLSGILMVVPTRVVTEALLCIAGLTMATWIIGAPPAGEEVGSWPILLHNRSSGSAMAISLVAFIAGVGAFLAGLTTKPDI